MWCPSVSLSLWANAWLAGKAAPADVLDALSLWAPKQSVTAYDAVAAGHTGLPWPDVHDAGMFLVVSVLLLVLVRPALRRRLTPAVALPTGIQALEGKSALVLDRVARDEGQVKLDGQVWTARPLNDNDVYEPGERVTVMQINGATAVVFRDM